MMSASYINYVGALTPDNWAVTPVFTVGGNGQISFWAQGQDASYAYEVVGVFIKTADKGAWMQLGSDITMTGSDTQYTFDLSQYEGESVQIAIRHYHVTDMFQLNLDYVEVTGSGEPVTPTDVPPTPTDVPVEPTDVPVEPTDVPVEPTDVPVEPTDVPVEPTDVPVEPTEEPDVIFTVDSVYNVVPGSEITVNFSLEGEYEAHILNAWLEYDSDILTVVSATKGVVLTDAQDLDGMVTVDKSIPGSIRIGAILPDAPLTTEGVIVTVVFQVAEDFEGETVIEALINEFGYMPIGETIAEPISCGVVNGVISVEDEPVIVTPEPTEPVEPTDEPVEPTDEPGPGPQPPVTGAVSLIGLGIIAIATGAGIVLFRKKRD